MHTRMALAAVMMSVSLALAGPKEEIEARYKEVSAALGAKALARIAAVYVADATFKMKTPTGSDQVRGAESVAGMWQSPIGAGAVSFDVTIATIDVKGDALTESGTFVMKKKDASVFAKGTYSASWRRESKVWKIVSHDLVAEK